MSEGSLNLEWVNFANNGEPQYRIGDAVLMRHHRFGRYALQMVMDNPDRFETSVLFQYGTKIDPDNADPQLSVLRQVVDTHLLKNRLDPPEDELVVHLRLGNVKGFNRAPEVFTNYIKKLIRTSEYQTEQVTIVSALHFGKTFFKGNLSSDKAKEISRGYEDQVGQIMVLLNEAGIDARVYSHADIDRDFCFLSTARNLVLGNGHFSIAAAAISNARCFLPPWFRTGSELDIHDLLGARLEMDPFNRESD